MDFKPLICDEADREFAIEFASQIADVVDAALKLFAEFVDPTIRDKYKDVTDQIIQALKDGFSAPGVCDSIAESVANPIAVEFPKVGNVVHFSVKRACEKRKTALGC